MSRRIRTLILGLPAVAAIALALTLFSVAPVVAQGPPPFSANIVITANPDFVLCVGETISLTALWTANRDVTREEWKIDGTSQGATSIPGATSGQSSFNFTGSTAGTFSIAYHIWHHVQPRTDTEVVTVTVNPCDNDCPAAPAIANQYLRDKGIRPNDPLHREVIEEIAHIMHDEFGFDPCRPGYADDVEAYIDQHWF
ncbi:MAG TPA: hypothetical protein VFE29_04035 [Terriglobia bacterium]|nr:hypothetical protein [Terriglobia bacterium]